jgi:hypothetical protein
MSRLPGAVLALLLVGGCADSTTEEASTSYEAPTAPAPAPERAAADAGGGSPVQPAAAQLPPALPDSTLGRRLIRTADVGLVVDDVPGARRDAAMAVRRAGGFVGAENENRYGDRLEVRLTLRVPAARFDEVLAALTSDGDAVAHRNVRVEDVTEQYVDLEARLRARRAVLDRYLVLLARADDVAEILAVEARVAETQEAIEVAEGQLRALRDRVGLSTIELTISDDAPSALAGGPPFMRRVREAFAVGLAGVENLAVGIVALWPAWLILAAMGLALRALLRRRRPAAPAAPAAG